MYRAHKFHDLQLTTRLMPSDCKLTTLGRSLAGTADKVLPLAVGALGNELGAVGNADSLEN